MVFASRPLLSDRRFAARPVGAQSAIVTALAIRIFSRELTRVVFPTPGPPVMTNHFGDERNPARCLLAVSKRQLRSLLDPRDSLVDVNGGPGRLPNGKRLELFGDFVLGSVKCSEEHAATAFKIVPDNSAVL